MTQFRVTATELNVRPRPGTHQPPLGRLQQRAIVEKLGESGDWFFVLISLQSDNFRGDILGWVHSRYLAPASQPSVSVPATPPPELPAQPAGGVTTPSPPVAPSPPGEPFSIDSDLKHRPSPLTAPLIDQFLEDHDSPAVGIGAPVMAAAQKYGINATYIIAHAIHESNYGKSWICQVKNNLFGWRAFDVNPAGEAKEFSSPGECIDFVMGRIDKLYLTPGGRYFEQKPCLGTQSYGMNVHYATDLDWGTKIAKHARIMEKWAGTQVLAAPPAAGPVETGPPPGPALGSAYPTGARRILAAVDYVNPEQWYYQKHDITGDEVPETFCNWFVADVLDVLGVSIPRYKPADEAGDYARPHPIYGYDKTKTKPWSATELNRYLGRGGDGKWHRASRVNAVTLANQGTAVVVSIPGHIALVIPGGQGEAVRIAQAGRICGKNLRLEEGFGHREVEFFSFTA
jgi:hypothetical protein